MSFRGVLGHELVGSVVHGPAAWQGKRVAGYLDCVDVRQRAEQHGELAPGQNDRGGSQGAPAPSPNASCHWDSIPSALDGR